MREKVAELERRKDEARRMGGEERLRKQRERGKLTVRYGGQLVFPGLYELVMGGRFDPGLLHPVRGVATDDCTLTPDLTGWRADGRLQFLPGSIWAGAHGY